MNGKYFPVVTPMTCYLVTSPFEDCSCHGSDVHDGDTSKSEESLVEELVAAEADPSAMFIRADVATADVNTELRSYAKLPSGIQTGDDGVLRTR